jgi:deferrochelatase/peroxidase EfeB
MDKWDTFTSRIQQAILAEEPEAAVAAAFAFAAEFGRQIERIADALQPVNIEAEPEDDGQAKFDL